MRTLKLIFISALLTGCNSVIPANFWFNFKSGDITKKFSDHGPYGGTTTANWQLTGEQLTTYELIHFAEKHNWKYLSTETEFNFPYEANQLEDLGNYLTDYHDILTFKTNCIIVEPGTGESFDALGYVFLNAERTKMTVFHRWGE